MCWAAEGKLKEFGITIEKHMVVYITDGASIMITFETMMWPPQNFFLYNGTIIKIKVNERINN